MQNIKLQSSDNEIFECDLAVAKCSGTIRTMLEDLGIDENSEDEVVPLPNVNSAILRKVIQFCTYHKDDPVPTSTDDDENKEKRTDDITSWDADFLKVCFCCNTFFIRIYFITFVISLFFTNRLTKEHYLN